MYCQNCHANNTSRANFCSNCGAPLKQKTGSTLAKVGKGLLSFLLLCLVISGLYLARGWFLKTPPATQNNPPVPPPAESSAPAPKQQLAVTLPAADLEIFTPWGSRLPTIATVPAEGKMVVPARACLGGSNFILKTALGTKQILKGFWRKGNPLIVWQTEEPAPAPPEADFRLAPWKREQPLRWVPVAGSIVPQNATVTSVKSAGDFLSCLLAHPVHENGVLIQDNHLVGWTFKDDSCYLWNETTAARLASADIQPADFYKATFAGGREEYLAKAMHLPPETAPAARLAALLEALRLDPKLSPADVPQNLRPEALRETMASLTAQVMASGQYRDLVAVFSNPELSAFLDEKRIAMTVSAALDRYGYDSAIQLLGIILENSSGRPALVEQSQVLRTRIFRDWLGKLIADKDTRGGWRLFSEVKTLYPLNPEFQLLGVELALQESDWQQAEKLLTAMHYPADLQGRANSLAALISQLKGQDGKITIHFPAGHKIIPVTAVLNDTLKHNFYIDTGATMVTIPLATAEELGIEITPDTPQRLVTTAGGIQTAYEVTIHSITIGNWVVYDTRAFILDIPDTPKTGLLGLNFLRKFRMDLDTEKGVLVLEPL